MNYMNVYLVNYYLDRQNKLKKRREKNRKIFGNKVNDYTDLTSKKAQTKINNLEVNL